MKYLKGIFLFGMVLFGMVLFGITAVSADEKKLDEQIEQIKKKIGIAKDGEIKIHLDGASEEIAILSGKKITLFLEGGSTAKICGVICKSLTVVARGGSICKVGILNANKVFFLANGRESAIKVVHLSTLSRLFNTAKRWWSWEGKRGLVLRFSENDL